MRELVLRLTKQYVLLALTKSRQHFFLSSVHERKEKDVATFGSHLIMLTVL